MKTSPPITQLSNRQYALIKQSAHESRRRISKLTRHIYSIANRMKTSPPITQLSNRQYALIKQSAHESRRRISKLTRHIYSIATTTMLLTTPPCLRYSGSVSPGGIPRQQYIRLIETRSTRTDARIRRWYLYASNHGAYRRDGCPGGGDPAETGRIDHKIAAALRWVRRRIQAIIQISNGGLRRGDSEDSGGHVTDSQLLLRAAIRRADCKLSRTGSYSVRYLRIHLERRRSGHRGRLAVNLNCGAGQPRAENRDETSRRNRVDVTGGIHYIASH